MANSKVTCQNCGRMLDEVTEAHLKGRRCFSRGNNRRAYAAGLRFVRGGVRRILKMAGVPITMVPQGRGWPVRGSARRKMVYHPWAPRTAVLLGNLIYMSEREGDVKGRYSNSPVGGRGVYKDRVAVLKKLFGETMKLVSINLGMDPTPVLREMAEQLGVSELTFNESRDSVIEYTDGYY